MHDNGEVTVNREPTRPMFDGYGVPLPWTVVSGEVQLIPEQVPVVGTSFNLGSAVLGGSGGPVTSRLRV